MMLCQSQYLKHDYIVISNWTQFYWDRKLCLCYLILSFHLTLRALCFVAILFASSLTSPHENCWHKSRHLVSPCSLSCNPALMHVNDQRGGHRTMKFSTTEFLSDFVKAHGQQVETGETYHIRKKGLILEDTWRHTKALRVYKDQKIQSDSKIFESLVQIGKISEKLSKIFGNLSKVFS